MGKNSATIKACKHNKLDVFGKGCEKDERFWNSVVRQALIERLLVKDIDNYGILKVSQEGLDFMDHPKSFMITLDHDYENTEDDDFFAAGIVILQRLRDQTHLSILQHFQDRGWNASPQLIFVQNTDCVIERGWIGYGRTGCDGTQIAAHDVRQDDRYT